MRKIKENAMPLSLAQEGKKLKIVKIAAEYKVKKHLESLGITMGAEIVVIAHSAGNSVCLVKDSRLALDAQLSQQIWVA